MTSTENSTNGVNLDENGVDWDGIDEMAETVKNVLIVLAVFGFGFLIEFALYWIMYGH